MDVHNNLIDGHRVPARDGRIIEDRNPADWREMVACVPRSGPKDVHAAVEAARRALPAWSATPAPKRAHVLLRSAVLLEERKDVLAKFMTREMGKPLKETRGDVQEAIDTAYFFAGEGRRLYGQTMPSELPDKLCLTFRRPVGVCGLITPWNFPIAVPSWKVYPALIAGNTLVLKPAEDTPVSALYFAEILSEAGLPDGVLNVVTGFGAEAGDALVRHKDVALLSFTGSAEIGARVASICGASLRRVALELGGKNAQIVLEDADIDLAVEGALWGAFATAGQRCTATSRLVIHEKIYKKFLDALVARAKKIKLGNASVDPSVEVGPVINATQLKRIDGYVRGAVRQGARLVLGGRIARRADLRHGSFYEPTIFSGVSPGMTIAREEVFGPVTCVLRVKSYEEAVRVVNDTEYGLSSSIYTHDVNRAARAISDIQSGITYVNSPTIGAEAHLPFGGVKKTGNGFREAGPTALDVFTEWKTVYLDHSARLQKAQVD
jgi:aldehyde dehydrogenase (NAD+)